MVRMTALLITKNRVDPLMVFHHILETIPQASNISVTVTPDKNREWVVEVSFLSEDENIRKIDVFPPSLIYKSHL